VSLNFVIDVHTHLRENIV